MKTKLIKFAAILAVFTMPVTGFAAHPGQSYFGFNIGTADDVLLDQEDTGFKIYGGFRFSRNFSGEIAYVDFGEYNDGGNLVQQYGLAFNMVGYIPFSDSAELMIKAGLFDWTYDDGFSYFGETGTDLTYGIGLQLNLADDLSIRAEYEEFLDIAAPGGDVSLASAGLTFHF